MYYRPRLPNGKLALLPWQLRLFFFNANWPLKDDANLCKRFLDKLSFLAEFLSLTVIVEAEFNFIVANRNNLGLVLETLATATVSTELFMRIINMASKRNDFKELISEFYERIHIERIPENEELWKKLQRKSLPTRIISYTYFLTLYTYFAVPIIGFFSNELLFPYKLKLHYDYHWIPLYLITLWATIWSGTVVVTHMVAEANTLALLILNLNGRYLILQRELSSLYDQLKESKVSKEFFVPKYREGLIQIIRRNYKLNRFARRIQSQYSFRIFIMMGLSSILLCVLGFKCVTIGTGSSQNITYVLWICTKIVELVVFGEVGSTIIETTDRMSVSYFHSNWEDVILNSDNSRDNIEIMKMIMIAIELNQKPISFTGFNFFRVSLTTVITILQAAGSYFTCLYAIY